MTVCSVTCGADVTHEQIDMQSAANDGFIDGPLHVETMGSPEALPMVFLHPNPLDGSSWLFQTAHLSTWFHCLSIDLPGYGRSPTCRQGVTLEELAQACWDAVERLHPKGPVVLVGCSVGSHVARHMYHQHPDRVSAIVLSGAGWRAVKQYASHRARQYRQDGIEARYPHVLEGFSEEFRRTPLARWFAQVMLERNESTDVASIVAMFDALSVPDPDWLHAELRAPLLVVSGTEDGAHESAFALVERLPNGSLLALEGAGHACQIERPWEFNAAVIEFLRAHELV